MSLAMNETEVAWLAGLIEGEAYVGQYTYRRRGDKEYTKTVLQVDMNDYDVVAKLKMITNRGGVWSKKPRQGRTNETWVWMVTNRQHVKEICEQILPHMGIRRTEKILGMFPDLAGGRLQRISHKDSD
jgi:hypothetical protein